MLSVDYHHQNFEWNGKSYFVDSFDRKEFEVIETLTSKLIGTCTAHTDEELQEKVDLMFHR